MSHSANPRSSASGAKRQQQLILLLGVTVMAVGAVVLIALINRPRALPVPLPTLPPAQVDAAPTEAPTDSSPADTPTETAVADAGNPGPTEATGDEAAPTADGAADGENPGDTAASTGEAVAAAVDPTGGEADPDGTDDSVFVVAESGPYALIVHGLTEEGMPRLGQPDAPVLLENFSSFGCGHCANFHDNQFMQLLDDVRAGRLQIVYVPVTNQFAAAASAAALCALDQGRFWEMHDLLYNWLRQYANSAYTLDRIMLGASALGLDLPTFEACLMGEEIFDRMNNANALFGELAQQYPGEVTGTPTISINGVPPVTSPGHRSGALPLDTLREAINAAQ